MTDKQIQTLESIKEIVSNIRCMNYDFIVTEYNGKPTLQIQFDAACNVNGGNIYRQYCRHWVLQYTMCTSEIVRTAYKAAKAAMEHELDEQFKYKEQMIYSPHWNVELLVEMRQRNNASDKRVSL